MSLFGLPICLLSLVVVDFGFVTLAVDLVDGVAGNVAAPVDACISTLSPPPQNLLVGMLLLVTVQAQNWIGVFNT